jgi:alpha-beta hydrolase superfamily lysophospholipase
MGATAITGASDLANRVSKKSKECPNMQFAVMGYSVGGGIAASGLKQIPQGVRSRVKAVVLYAPFGGASAPSDFRGRTLKNCAKGDSVSAPHMPLQAVADGRQVCLNGSNLAAHISYNTKGTKWHNASVKFIVAAFQGHPLAGNPETAWTQPWLKSIAGI